MTTITQFKQHAKLTHDNKENARKEWHKTWGISYWRSLWAYKEYTAERHGQTFQFRTGTAHFRYGGRAFQEYLINGKCVGKTDFLRSFEDAYHFHSVVKPKLTESA